MVTGIQRTRTTRRGLLAVAAATAGAGLAVRATGGEAAIINSIKIDQFNSGESTTSLTSSTQDSTLQVLNSSGGDAIRAASSQGLALDVSGDVKVAGSLNMQDSNPGPLVDIRNKQASGVANAIRAAIGNAPVLNRGATLLGVSAREPYPGVLGYAGVSGGTGVQGEASVAGNGIGVHGLASAETGTDTAVRAEAVAPGATALDVVGSAKFSKGASFAGAVQAASFTGDGSALEGVSAARLSGALAANVPLKNAAANAFAGTVTAAGFGGPDASTAPSFSNAGVVNVPAGKAQFNVVLPSVRPGTLVLATLQGNAGQGVAVQHVLVKTGKFGVYLTKAATRPAKLAYFVIGAP